MIVGSDIDRVALYTELQVYSTNITQYIVLQNISYYRMAECQTN